MTDENRKTPRQHIREAEATIAKAVNDAVEKLQAELDMAPTAVDIEFIDTTSFERSGPARTAILGSVRLRF